MLRLEGICIWVTGKETMANSLPGTSIGRSTMSWVLRDSEVKEEIIGKQGRLGEEIIGNKVYKEDLRVVTKPRIRMSSTNGLATGKWASTLIIEGEETVDTREVETNSGKGNTFSLKITCILVIILLVET